MAVLDDKQSEGQHDDLGVPQERREAEAAEWEKRLNGPSAAGELHHRENPDNPAGLESESGPASHVPQEDKAVTKPNLQAMEGRQSSGHKPTADSDGATRKKSATSEDLQGAESAAAVGVGAGLAKSKGSGDSVGKGYNPNDSSRLSKFKTWASESKHKKSLIGGSVGGGIIGLIILAIVTIVPYELVHIEKNLLGHEAQIEQRFERKSARNLLQHMICWQLKVGCSKFRNYNNKPSAADEAKAEASGEVLTAEMDKFNFTDPQVISDLANKGITVETDAAGNFTGLKDAQGNDITESIATDDTAFDSVEAALPEWSVGQEISFRPAMVNEAGSSFNVLSDDDTKSAQTEIEDSVAKGANAEDISAANAEEKTSTGNTAADQQAASTASTESQQLQDATNTVETDLANGMSEQSAIADAASKFGGGIGQALLWSAIATGICEVKEVADAGAKDRIPTIITALIRHGTSTLSLADQLKTGKITGNEVNQTMQIFNGDSSAPPNADGTTSEAALPFSASAAWQRATNQPVTTNTPDIDPAALPTDNAGQQIVNEIDQIFNAVPGGNAVCSVLTSGWGIIAQFGLGFIQLGATIFSGGEVDVGTIVAGTSASVFLQKVVIPNIIKYFTPVAVSGHEDSVQWLNNSDAGLNLAFGNYSRRLGGSAITNTQADTLTAAANNEALADNSHLSWVDRTFSISNPYSLISRLANDLPLGLKNASSGIIGYFTRLPAMLLHGLASIFTRHAFAQTATNPGESYGFTQYAFTDNEVDKYDQVGNEQYLFGNVSYGGKSDSRIDMLGNPNNYKDNPNGDSDNSDLLHCYVDSYAIIEESFTDQTTNFNPGLQASQDPGADQNCGVLGLFDLASDPPNATDTPSDTTVESIYCQYFTGSANNQGCMNAIASQVKDDVGHFRQYLLDTHVMADYTSLINNQ